MSSEPAAEQPPATTKPDDGLGQVAVGALFLGSLWMVYLGAADYLLPAYRVTYVYVQTTATVLDTALEVLPASKGSEKYNPKVLLRYEAGGQVREEWCRLDWSEPYSNKEGAESDLRGYPVGWQVTAWYDPERPGRVSVSRDAGYLLGFLLLVFGLFLPGLMVGVPLLVIALTAWRHWRHLEQTTGCVVGGEVREVPLGGGEPAFRPVLLIEYDRGAAPSRGTIPASDHPDRAAAEAELRTLLSAYPPGEQRALWYDPRNHEDPTFAPVTIGGFAVACALAVIWPVLALVFGVLQFGRRVWWGLTAPPSAVAERDADRPRGEEAAAEAPPRDEGAEYQRGSQPPPEVPPWQRALWIAAALATIGLSLRYVFWQDYSCYFRFEPVMGTVVATAANFERGVGYEPKVRFGYTVNGQYYERWTHGGWHSTRTSPFSKEEADAILSAYPVGSQVLVWYDPDWPLMGILKRYARWHLYPILIPPLWVLVAQTRKLLRRQ
jgi:hypothetical protein